MYIVLTTGVASSLGVGVYVIAGQVAREQAGPAVVLTFLIAAVTSFLSGKCTALATSPLRLLHSVVYWGGTTQSSWAFMCIIVRN